MAELRCPAAAFRGARIWLPMIGVMREAICVTAVLPTEAADYALRPLDAAGVHVTGGFWQSWMEVNRSSTLPHGARQLHRANNLANFAALIDSGDYRAGHDDSGATFPFLGPGRPGAG